MNAKIKKYVVPNLPYLFIFCLAAGADFGAKLIGMMKTIGPAFGTIAPGLSGFDLLVGLVGAVALRLVVYNKVKNAKKFRKDVEYGSARWSA